MIHDLHNKAMLFHSVTSGHHQQGVLATLHDITVNDNEPAICEGKLMTLDDVYDIFAWLNNIKPRNTLSYLDATVIASAENAMVWFLKGQMRPMLFQINSHHRRIMVKWPNLVFKVKDHTLSVVAVRSLQRPNQNTALYHAPLMNIYADSRVCTGNATLPEIIDITNRQAWENIIFDTYFTHVNHDHTLKSSCGDHYAYWKSRNKLQDFDTSCLVPMRKTLGDWIND